MLACCLPSDAPGWSLLGEAKLHPQSSAPLPSSHEVPGSCQRLTSQNGIFLWGTEQGLRWSRAAVMPIWFPWQPVRSASWEGEGFWEEMLSSFQQVLSESPLSA